MADSSNGVLEAKLETTHTKLDALAEKLTDLAHDIRKALDDHEERLREQAKVDASQGKEIAKMQTQHVEMSGTVKRLEEKFEALEKERDRERERDMDFWQRVAFEAIRFAALGLASGGTVAGALQLLGGM